MRIVKRILLVFLIAFTFGGTLLAQEEAPRVALSFSERCNNFLRHYCLPGNHEVSVNRLLLDMKKKGEVISSKLIKRIAQTTPSRLRTRAAQTQ